MPQAKGIAFEDRASLIQQSSAFADPCTFRLIAKNVTSLLTDREAEAGLKVEATQSLDALLRCDRTNCLLCECSNLGHWVISH